MKYLLDTDTCVWLLRNRSDVRARAASELPSDLAVATMTEAELRLGALGSDDPAGELRRADALLGTLAGVLPFDRDAARHHADLQYAIRAQRIGEHDLIIAAVAVSRGLTVVTGNVREFGRIPGLQVENWRAA